MAATEIVPLGRNTAIAEIEVVPGSQFCFRRLTGLASRPKPYDVAAGRKCYGTSSTVKLAPLCRIDVPFTGLRISFPTHIVD